MHRLISFFMQVDSGYFSSVLSSDGSSRPGINSHLGTGLHFPGSESFFVSKNNDKSKSSQNNPTYLSLKALGGQKAAVTRYHVTKTDIKNPSML